MSEIRVNNITNRDGSTGTTVAGIPVVDSTSHFVVPSGNTAERGSRGRGVFFSGSVTATGNVIQYITIATTGNTTDFGDMNVQRTATSSYSSSTRGIAAGGYSGSPAVNINNIEYITISSTGNGFDFGDLPVAGRNNAGGFSDSVRGMSSGYITNAAPSTGGIGTKDIYSVIIASLGNAFDFGEMSAQKYGQAGFSSPTRGVFGGGYFPFNVAINVIDYKTITSSGEMIDFGDVSVARGDVSAAASETRGVMAGGKTAPAITDVIDYVTIASTGDAIDFGDLTSAVQRTSSVSNKIRGVYAGGLNPGLTNTMEYITIATVGNAADFGDLYSAFTSTSAVSDAHGGLG